MNTLRNKIAIFVCSSAILLSSACTGIETQGIFYGLYYGLGALNVASEFVGDYKTMRVDLGPGATKEDIFKVKKYALIQPWSLKKNVPDDTRSIIDAFLSRLIQEIRTVSVNDIIVTEDELIAASPALKEASDIGAYIEAAHAKELDAIITTKTWLHNEGHLITGFKLVLWDTTTSGKKRLLATMHGEFKAPKKIDAAAVSIANTFFKSSPAPTAVSK
ncbi:MAG: hypothetical protein HZC04_01315 [Candidatus Lloydbacteria bacterium]|nr:hypothetical protein [Candidatus Lloydbacteria bacterium]